MKKVCKKCKYFYEGEKCPICNSTTVANAWQGRIFIIDPEKSEIAKKIGYTIKGEYALKVK